MYEQSIQLVDFLQGALTSVYMVLGSPSRKVTVPNYPGVQCSLRTVGHSVFLTLHVILFQNLVHVC